MNEGPTGNIYSPEAGAKLGTLPPIHQNKTKQITVRANPSQPETQPMIQANSANLILPPGFEQAGRPGPAYGQRSNQQAWNTQSAVPLQAQVPQYPTYQPHGHQQHRQPDQFTPDPMAFEVQDATLSRKLGETSRIGFIRKVYAILCTQLAITAIFTVITLKSLALQEFMVKNTALFFIMMALYFITIYALACYPTVARSVPINYILTFIFTGAMSYMVAFISSRFDPNLVATAAILTAVMMMGLTTYACYTKTDFTMCGGFLFVMSFLLIGMIFVGIWVSNKFYHAVISVISIGLFSLYIIYDTQLIVGNKEAKYNLDDYILAAINLYLDIINLFLSILRLLGAASKSS